jgi:hypothetical protein
MDLKANSSASYSGTRIYPSLSWTVENKQKGETLGLALSSSSEFDYLSYGANINYAKKVKNNGELSAKFQVYLDKVKLLTPVELRENPNMKNEDYESAARNTYAGSVSYSQVINKNLQVSFIADLVNQQGYLSLPFYRVYFKDGSVHQEKLPENRLKIPLGFRANYFAGDKIIIRTYYRFYTDSWGLHSHTANLEIPVKITPFFSISPFYRFYNQSAVKYFGPYKQHSVENEYYSSNYDLSKFNSSFIGAGIRISPVKGVFRMAHFNMMEIRYGHYTRTNGLKADLVSLHLKFK